MQGQVAVVTGGASGIGRACCERFARLGAHVAVVDLRPQGVAAAVLELEALNAENSRHLGVPADVRDESAMEDMAAKIIERFGAIDILVASAGVLRAPDTMPKPLADHSPDEWDFVIDVNLKGVFLANRAVLPIMMKRRSGAIVNISSTSGLRGRPMDAPYSASKFGVIGMSEALAEEVRSFGIKVQVVCPDAVDTPIWRQNGHVPCPADALTPEHVADLIAYMLTQPRDMVLGTTVVAPFKTRKRKKKAKEPVERSSASESGQPS